MERTLQVQQNESYRKITRLSRPQHKTTPLGVSIPTSAIAHKTISLNGDGIIQKQKSITIFESNLKQAQMRDTGALTNKKLNQAQVVKKHLNQSTQELK
jgi:hypothetical protein